jgi:hypothetical protein
MKKNRKKKPRKTHGDSMLLTLCAKCAAQFYDSDEHIIRRVNPNQRIKETCCYCSCRQGFDYTVQRRTKPQ